MATKRRTHKIVIEENMTIYTASSQKVMLLEAVSNCQELDLDLSQVGEMDTAGFRCCCSPSAKPANQTKCCASPPTAKKYANCSTSTTWAATSATRS